MPTRVIENIARLDGLEIQILEGNQVKNNQILDRTVITIAQLFLKYRSTNLCGHEASVISHNVPCHITDEGMNDTVKIKTNDMMYIPTLDTALTCFVLGFFRDVSMRDDRQLCI